MDSEGRSTMRLMRVSRVLGLRWKLFYFLNPHMIGFAKYDNLTFYGPRTFPAQDADWFMKQQVETYDVLLEQSGNIAIDVGAGVGSYSLRLAKRFKQVYAFEPNPDIRRFLRMNVNKNTVLNVRVMPDAVSDKSGKAEMRLSPGTPSGATIASKHYSWVKFESSIIVPTLALDDYFLGKDKVDLIKIDAEGHELAVLKGAEQIIREYHPLMSVEVHQRPQDQERPRYCDCNVCNYLRDDLGLQVELHGRYTPNMEAHWLICQ